MTEKNQVRLLVLGCLTLVIYGLYSERTLRSERALDQLSSGGSVETGKAEVVLLVDEQGRGSVSAIDEARQRLLEFSEKWGPSSAGVQGGFSREEARAFKEFLESCSDLTAAEFIELATSVESEEWGGLDFSLLTVAVRLDGAATFAAMTDAQLARYGSGFFPAFYARDPAGAQAFLNTDEGALLGQLPKQQIALSKMKLDYRAGLEEFVSAGGRLWNLGSYLEAIGIETGAPEMSVELLSGIDDRETKVKATRDHLFRLLRQGKSDNFKSTVELLYPDAGVERDQLFYWRTWQQVNSPQSADALLDLSYDRSRSAYGITDQWAREDRFLEDAAQWVRSLEPGVEKDAARKGFLERVGKRDEALVGEWAERLE